MGNINWDDLPFWGLEKRFASASGDLCVKNFRPNGIKYAVEE